MALQVPEFETDVMELLAMRRRDRPHGVVANALWDELKRSGTAAGASMKRRWEEGRRASKRVTKQKATRARPAGGRRNAHKRR